jgi:hypothetical protein
VLLGVALASKQYLVFLLPVVLLYTDAEGRRSGWWSVGTAGIVTLAPALLGPSEYFRAIVGNALDIGFRPDTQSINGAIATLGGKLILPVALTIPLVAVLFLAYRKRVGNELLPAAGVLTLAVVFLMTSAFPNYWMLLVGLAGMSAMFASTQLYASGIVATRIADAPSA